MYEVWFNYRKNYNVYFCFFYCDSKFVESFKYDFFNVLNFKV